MVASLLVCAMTLGQAELATPASETIAAEILQKKYKSVGVVPRIAVRVKTRPNVPEYSLRGGAGIGPQAEVLASLLERNLRDKAEERFTVVDGKTIRDAFAGMKDADLENKGAVAKAAGKVEGLQAVVVAAVTDQRDVEDDDGFAGLTIECKLIEIRTGEERTAATEKMSISLADAAYMGESWELRRWAESKTLTNVGLDDSDDQPTLSPFGQGPRFDKLLYRAIRQDRPHPLADPNSPFRINVRVGGKDRMLFAGGGKRYYTPLDPGEAYEIIVENRCQHKVYMALFVDGINVKEKLPEHPEECAHERLWTLGAAGKYAIDGWHTRSKTANSYEVEEFKIQRVEESVAQEKNFTRRLGMITGVFYTVGMEGVPKAPKDDRRGIARGGHFATGRGAVSTATLKEGEATPRGLILAAVTIHYVPTDQFERIKGK